MAVNDLAGSALEGTYDPEQLYAGDAPIHTGAAKATTDITKYEVVKKSTTTGTVARVATVGSDLGQDYVIAAQPSANGKDTPYFDAGHFNHEVLVWPSDLDTLVKRQAFFRGTMIFVGAIVPGH
ncbi:hypothetical protein D3C87_812750 [compost metagenome]